MKIVPIVFAWFNGLNTPPSQHDAYMHTRDVRHIPLLSTDLRVFFVFFRSNINLFQVESILSTLGDEATGGKEGKDEEGEGAAVGGGEQSRRREIAVACLTTIRRCGAVDAAKVRVQCV